MEPCPDPELLRRWQSGDETAFTSLVQRHQAMVVAVARRVLGDHHAAEDVAQAAFLVLARKASSLVNGGSDIGGWLHRVTRDLARDRRSADTARRHHEGAVMPIAADPDSVINTALRSEFLRQFDDAIATLPERQRACLVLHHLEGLPVTQVAIRLGSPEGSVCQWLSRGRERLRDILHRRGVAVSATLLLALLGDNALAAAETTLPLGPASEVAKKLAQAHLRQQAMHTVGWIAAGIAAAGIAAAGVYVGLHLDLPTTPPAVAMPVTPAPPKAPDMPIRPVLAATLTAVLTATAPAVTASDASGAAPSNAPAPSGVGSTPNGIRQGNGAPAGGLVTLPPETSPTTISQDQATTLGQAATVLTKGDLVVRVSLTLGNIPIVYGDYGRFSGTALQVVQKIATSHGAKPAVVVIESAIIGQDRKAKRLITISPASTSANPNRDANSATPAGGQKDF